MYGRTDKMCEKNDHLFGCGLLGPKFLVYIFGFKKEAFFKRLLSTHERKNNWVSILYIQVAGSIYIWKFQKFKGKLWNSRKVFPFPPILK